MKYKLSQSQIKELVRKIYEKINSDDYVILISRDKNKKFIREYNLNHDSIKSKILSKISISNFVSEETDDNTLKYGIDPVAIFHIKCDLINFLGEEKEVKVYVKIKLDEPKHIVISLHECEK